MKVFYVFPTIGSTAELMDANFFLEPHLRYLDVHSIPGTLGLPTTKSGTVRKNEVHYFDLHPDTYGMTIHSDPVSVSILDTERLAFGIRSDDSKLSAEPDFELVRGAREFLDAGRNRVALFLPNEDDSD